MTRSFATTPLPRARASRISVVSLPALCALLLCQQTNASALSDAANALQPGQWATLTTSGFTPALLDDGGTIFAYSEELKWDSQAREMHFIGAYHYQPVHHVVYSEATNTWTERSLSAGVFGEPFHSYDHMAIDPASRTMWVRPFGVNGNRLERYNLDSKQWSETATFDGSRQDAVGIEFFPDMQRVVYIDEGAVRLYSPGSNSWSLALDRPAGLGPYHCIAEYSPAKKVMIMGGGNGSRALYRMNSSGQITRLKDAPFTIGVTNSIVTVDPVGGNFLVFGRDKSFWEFDAIADTWRSLPQAPFVNSGGDFPDIQNAAASPIAAYGVVMVTKYAGSGSRVYLYKHATSIRPNAPTNVTAE